MEGARASRLYDNTPLNKGLETYSHGGAFSQQNQPAQAVCLRETLHSKSLLSPPHSKSASAQETPEEL